MSLVGDKAESYIWQRWSLARWLSNGKRDYIVDEVDTAVTIMMDYGP